MTVSGRTAPQNRPVILTIANSVKPGAEATGPVQSLSLLLRALSREFEFRIVGTKPAAPVASSVATPADWVAHEGGSIRYQRSSRFALGASLRLLKNTRYDALYINGYFDGIGTLSLLAHRILRRPGAIILAPKGELSPGAIQIKRWRKIVFWRLSRFFGLHKGIVFQASNDRESREILARYPGAAVVVASDIAHDGSLTAPSIQVGCPLKLIYLSRIDSIKNLHLALETLARLDRPIVFDIYGPVSNAAYWARCHEIMQRLPANIKATYRGEVCHAQVTDTLRAYDLFFLPTGGENFGHAIVESLSAGVPVLISDRTPWRNLEAAEAGFDLPLDEPESFGRCIERFATFPKEKRERFAKGALNAARRMVDNAGAIEAHRSMFLQAINGRSYANTHDASGDW